MSPSVRRRRIPSPTAAAIKRARRAAGLSQHAAALLVQLGAKGRWSEYERGVCVMDVARWELFLLLTGQHPTLRLYDFDLGQRLRDIVERSGGTWTPAMAATLVPNGPNAHRATRRGAARAATATATTTGPA